MSSEPLAFELRAPREDPQGAIVLFHGRGTNEHDLVPLFDLLDPERSYLGLAPRGPLSLPPGGAHWYAAVRIGYPDRDSFHSTYSQASAWLDNVLEQDGIPIERTLLGGFSQGAVMSYSLAFGRGRPAPAGVLALSGFIPTVEGFELDLSGREGLPVAIGHGTGDPVIGVEWGRDARERLTAAGAAITYREYPLPHMVDPGFLEELRREWLPGVLGYPQPPHV